MDTKWDTEQAIQKYKLKLLKEINDYEQRGIMPYRQYSIVDGICELKYAVEVLKQHSKIKEIQYYLDLGYKRFYDKPFNKMTFDELETEINLLECIFIIDQIVKSH